MCHTRIMELPVSYSERMKKQLGEEYEAYLRSFEQNSKNGLRVNTAKLSPAEFEALSPFSVSRVPWVDNGYFYEGERPAVHPYYYAGLYYLQEPSAMTPACLLPVNPGERVLDLCAAPGGKSTELAAKLKGEGVLVSNDISNSRAKALLKNLELFGAPNILVVSETPNKLADYFPEYFDKILVDAPCSGEGMFRKSPVIMKNWEQYGTGYYHKLQSEILPQAVKMLRTGGLLLYSTCTFSPEEDEGSVTEVLEAFPEMELVPALSYAPEGCSYDGFDKGHPEWIENGTDELKKTVRLWPHKINGEGHFIALFRKKGEERTSFPETRLPKLTLSDEALDFFGKLGIKIDTKRIELRGEQLYMLPEGLPSTKGLRILRSGLLLGEEKKKRFEPSQALACALKSEQYGNILNLPASDERVLRYLKCETIDVPEKLENGWALVCVDGYTLGWGKYSDGNFKNRYFAGWRHM